MGEIGRNTLVLLASLGSAQALNFFAVALLARGLGADGFGRLSLAIVITRVLFGVIDMGLRKVQVRDMARGARLDFASLMLGLKLPLIAVLVSVATVAWRLLESNEGAAGVLLWMVTASALSSIAQVHYATAQAEDDYRAESATNVLRACVLLIVCSVLLKARVSEAGAAAAYAAAEAACLAWTLRFTSARRAWPPHFEAAFSARVLREALPFGLTGAFETVYHWLDSMMLRAFKDATAVGLYSAAYRLFLVALQLPSAVNVVLHPAMARLDDGSRQELSSLFSSASRYLASLAFLVAWLLFAHAEGLVGAVFGGGYTDAVPVLRVLCLSIVLVGLNSSFVRRLETSGRQAAVSKVSGISAAANVALNLLLIPRWGLEGAASATVASEAVITIGVFHVARRDAAVSWPGLLRDWAVMAASAAGALFLCIKLASPVGTGLAVVLYLAVMTVSGIWPPSQLRQLATSLLGRRNLPRDHSGPSNGPA